MVALEKSAGGVLKRYSWRKTQTLITAIVGNVFNDMLKITLSNI
jgi:hypothetical protein